MLTAERLAEPLPFLWRSFDAGDDAICLKSGKDEEGRKRGVPTENVLILDCTVYHGHGGFVVGSEMSGGIRNIFLDRCAFIGTDNGIRFKSTRGRGGVVENIYLNHINMADIKNDAILYDLYYGGNRNEVAFYPVNETTPCFRNIHMKGIHCVGAGRAALFQGLPEMKLSQVSLTNAIIEAKSGITCLDTDQIILTNVTIKPPEHPTIYYHKTDISSLEN